MPSKRNIRSSNEETTKKKKVVEFSDDDVEEFQNSEDEYASQSGGESEVSENELDSDSSTLDIDPDDEVDLNEDDKYDPVNEGEEVEDTDEEIEENEAAEEEVEEEMNIGEEGEEGEDFETGTKPCHMKNLNKDFIVLDEDDSSLYSKMEYKKIADEDRETDPVMTYYEMVRIIGTRAQQFNFGAEPLVKGLDGLHPARMAYLELVAKMTPYIIRRHLPSKKYEEWKISELEIIHQISDSFFVPEKFDWAALMKQANEFNKSEIIDYSKSTSKKSSKSKQSRVKTTSGSKTSNKTRRSKKIIK